ncbi:hypothetical protein CHLNCDRAFT_138470 [Chlorella variabilis]|uniref:PHD-type domain-containing protein n=1 Tax=Chlorella variabilis TaxID=554065 RepID=E1ZN45_CHLVA|nr:hypothetical protein CHLNCDRAFT_138470 [Chlorella variabilis]EFN52905.1 hypothetical protein CHLNCDRAFT_138470 [Chlorella variabilis]|eukprot:XP_005845007.1 hypothetical protein CHLNCDRAFT_138470 [Chlorella variabilis]
MPSKTKGLARREVLLPGDLLPHAHKCAGKHHGVILRVEPPAVPGGYPLAVIQMTDFLVEGTKTKKVKLSLPVEQAAQFVVAKKGGRPKREVAARSKEEEWARAAGVNYSIPRWASLDRERTPKKAKRAPDAPPLHGPPLQERLRQLEAAPASERFPPGTRLWVRVAGSGLWPGVAWAFALCKRRDWGQLLLSHRPGEPRCMLLVRFYGEHSNMWVREEDCELPPPDEGEHLCQLRAAGRQHNKMRLLELALSELEAAHPDPELERRRMVQLYEAYLQTRQALDTCYLCRELGADLECACCDRLFHPLCLHHPAVSSAELPGGVWACPCCGEEQEVGKVREEGEGGEVDGEIERMGLTPDWIVEAAAFRVFGLERPTAERPYIAGLLDPCTNSKLAPNIPAESLYDKQPRAAQDNGLKLSNSWQGRYVLLNPDYRAQVQWRFVNRAIDEVENGGVPAVVLVCRNSTDTGYFQRLRPYPRVLLRRLSARFKDYEKTPIGFGIAVFCIAKSNVRRVELYSRFYDAFEGMGEPNIPTREFFALLDRLRVYADQHHRDHWVQCTACSKWRIVDFRAAQQIGDDTEWNCAMLRPPFSSCQTPLSKNETVGGHYAARGADWAGSGDEEEGGAARCCALGAGEGEPGSAVEEAQAHQSPRAAAAASGGTAVDTPVAARGERRQARAFGPGRSSGPSSPVAAAASVVVCASTLHELVKLPPRNASLASEEGGDSQVLTALELARQARIAANRAYLAGLGLGPKAMSSGQVPPLAPNDPVMLAAAWELARRAAAEQGRQQLEEVRRRYEAARRRRQREEPRLLAALRELQVEEQAAWHQLEQAECAAAELKREQHRQEGGEASAGARQQQLLALV